MKVYKYNSYDEYLNSQKKGFEKKKSKCWAVEENIKFLSNYILSTGMNPDRGLCHGVRQGFEQKWFMKYLPECHVLGSELGGIIGENTVEWDFNKQNPNWIGKFDFIYSNSFDHSFNPIATLNIWAEQLKPAGFICLEYDKRQEHTGEISMAINKMDPVSLTIQEIEKNISTWIPRSKIKDVIDMPVVKKVFQKTVIIQVK